MYYFDNAASTKVFKEAAEAALNCMLNIYGNPSSIHKFGLKSEKILEDCKKIISNILCCSSKEIFFTSGATESINMALIGAAKKEKKRKKILTTNIEHAATKNCLKYLNSIGFDTIYISPKNGVYVAEDFLNAVDENFFLVSIMHVNNENGLTLPVEEIAKLVKTKYKNILIHVDAAQSFCKIPINSRYIDFISISGHKINAPKGIGVLFIKDGVKISPILFGGEQQKGLRPGTQAVALIKALSISSEKNFVNIKNNIKHYEFLKKILVEKLKKNSNIYFNFNGNCVPYIINISIEGVKSQILLQFLEEKGFLISSGAACSKNYKNTILLNLGYEKKRQDTAIRISFSNQNSADDVENLCENIILAEKTIFKY